MPSVRKKRAQNRVTFETRKIEEKSASSRASSHTRYWEDTAKMHGQKCWEHLWIIETQLLITHAQKISGFEKEIDDDPVHPCCSCERLQQRKCVTRVSLSDNLGSKVWPALKAFIVEHNPDANKQVLYMCNFCKPSIKQDVLPARCVLSCLQTVPIPPELAKLD